MSSTLDKSNQKDNSPSNQIQNPKNNTSKEDLRFGLGRYRPPWAQFMMKPPLFMFFFASYIFFRSLATSGYLPAVLTTIERRFNFNSTEAGLIIASYDIGSLLAVIFVSYYGGKGHRIRWIAFGALLCGAVTIVFALPHWLSDTFEYQKSLISGDIELADVEKFLCQVNRTQTINDIVQCSESDKLIAEDVSKTDKSRFLANFMICNLLIGLGSSPINTLGTSFIWDNIRNAHIYVGIVYVSGAVGPAIGFLVSGGLLRVYIHPDKDSILEVDDENYMGAWWLGFVVFGVVVILTALPLFLYPSKLQEEEESNSDNSPDQQEETRREKPSGMSYGESLWDIPKTIWRLVKNPIFLLVTLSATCEFTIIQAFMKYIPKYLASQFSIAAYQSAILAGAIVVPAAGIGIVGGSIIIKKFSIGPTGCTKFILVTSMVALLFFIPTLFFSCKTQEIAGLSTEFYAPERCSASCGCATDELGDFYYDPICWEEREVTFYNPCAAGCRAANLVNDTRGRDRDSDDKEVYEFFECSCLDNSSVKV